MTTLASQNTWSEKEQDAIAKFRSKVYLCGCGLKMEWNIVKLLLERAKDKDLGFYDPMDGASEKWVEFGAKILDSWGLLEHGCGIGGAWLTDEGRLLLRFLNEFGIDSDNWPDWSL